MAIDVQTSSSVPTSDFIDVNVIANVTVKISSDKALISLGAENFLNRDAVYITGVAREVLEGNIREIIGQMTLKEMVTDRKKFADKVQENAKPDLMAMGLEIVSFNVQTFSDEHNLINDLGIDNITSIQKTAAITRAISERDIAIQRAKADQESNTARVEADTIIAQRDNELEIKRAELKLASDIKKAEADAAYKIQEQEQQKTIEITTANAGLAKLEKEIELKERSVAIKERELEASIKKQAEAEKFAVQQRADADLYDKQRDSEAQLFERQKRAEAELFETEKKASAEIAFSVAEKQQMENLAQGAKAKAEAERFAAEQEAEGLRAKGLAEAAAIQAKAEAEAQGILKKAEAMREYGEAATLSMQLDAFKFYAEQLPKVAEAVAVPLGQVDKITMYGDGNGAKLTGDLTKTINQVLDGLGDAGIDVKSLLGAFLGSSLAEKMKESQPVDVVSERVSQPATNSNSAKSANEYTVKTTPITPDLTVNVDDNV
jgi:flotillin